MLTKDKDRNTGVVLGVKVTSHSGKAVNYM